MPNTVFIVILFVLVLFLVFKTRERVKKITGEAARPDDSQKPTVPRDNDKLILVDGVSHDDIRIALTGFCNAYNKETFAALPRLWQLSTGRFAVTFPYDIDFVTFCFAINYLKYPMDIKWEAKVRAWTKPKASDEWIGDKCADKMAMLFLAVDDREYDNVFLTTEDNIGYKLGFAGGRHIKLLNTPKEAFVANPVDLGSLAGHPFEDID